MKNNNAEKINESNAMTDDLRVLAKNIRFIRKYIGLSRPKFADLLGVPSTTLKNYENMYRGTSTPLILSLFRNEKTKPFMPLVMEGRLLSECESELKLVLY